MATTAIEWTDRTWNPTRGCSVISPGCVNCYAMKQAHRFSGAGKPYHGLTKLTTAGPQWTGRVVLDEPTLRKPLSWRQPSRIFVNSMSDLFHESLPDEYIDAVFAVMALCPQHTFQVLTKRSERMCQYFSVRVAEDLLERWADTALTIQPLGDAENATEEGAARYEDVFSQDWPLPNVWLGVSVENQDQLYRIDHLKDTPAAVHFVSFEPLLEDLGAVILDGIEWVICGGESGPGARNCDLTWIRSIVEQCHAARVPVFVKQLGARPITSEPTYWPDGRQTPYPWLRVTLSHRKGGDWSEWPEYFRRREFPA